MLKVVSRVSLPSYVFLSATVNFSIIWGLFLALLLLIGRWPGWVLVALVPLLLIQQALAVGLGLVLGVTNVFFRDVAQAVGVGLQFWFWLTPIVYPLSAVPEACASDQVEPRVPARHVVSAHHRRAPVAHLESVVARGGRGSGYRGDLRHGVSPLGRRDGG
jgi:hypothetical protein